jgi:hypothetical protein
MFRKLIDFVEEMNQYARDLEIERLSSMKRESIKWERVFNMGKEDKQNETINDKTNS